MTINKSKGILNKKRTFAILFTVLLFPLLAVSYLGFNSIFERQKSTQQLIRSNLLISGESTLNKLEENLLAIENNLLNPNYFQDYRKDSLIEENISSDLDNVKRLKYVHFQLNNNFKIIYPHMGNLMGEDFNIASNEQHSNFTREMQKAEFHEFSKGKFNTAITLYKNCLYLAKNKRLKAIALEGMARSQFSLTNYSASAETYSILHKEYSKELNQAGHPYGLTSILQLYEISKHIKTKKNILEEILETYKKLRIGYWILSLSSYNFFISEFESILEQAAHKGIKTKVKNEYESVKLNSSYYLQKLSMLNYLKDKIIKKVKDQYQNRISHEDYEINRFLGYQDDSWILTSIKQSQGTGENIGYLGIIWNTDSLYSNTIPQLLVNISSGSELNYSLIENPNMRSSIPESPEVYSLISFNMFPLPLKLKVVQTAFSNLEAQYDRELLIYSILLIITVVVMILGIRLIVKDFKREADSMNLRTDFVHNVSHELKTPLSLIRLYGETLLYKNNLKDEDKKDGLRVITKESERLSHMINNILDFSKIEMGRKDFKFEKANFGNVIRGTLDSYRYHLEKNGFKIIEEISEEIPLIEFDKESIEGLLINLLSNAIKYSQENRLIIVKLFTQNGKVVLLVSDNGIGIPAEELPHIFDRFYRSEQKPGVEVRGSGLGLTLVKHVVESHKGSIQVESDPNEGSTFKIELPIEK